MPIRRGALDGYLVGVMKAQRSMFEANPEGGALLGGQMQKWSVSRDGIAQTVLCRFVDGPIDTEIAREA